MSEPLVETAIAGEDLLANFKKAMTQNNFEYVYKIVE